MTTDGLEELEARVTAKWAAAAADRIQGFSDMFDASAWSDVVKTSSWSGALPAGTAQFPREQWVSYPAGRTVALVLADRMLELDELSDEQWAKLCFIVQYGGKTRIA